MRCSELETSLVKHRLDIDVEVPEMTPPFPIAVAELDAGPVNALGDDQLFDTSVREFTTHDMTSVPGHHFRGASFSAE